MVRDASTTLVRAVRAHRFAWRYASTATVSRYVPGRGVRTCRSANGLHRARCQRS